MRWVLVILVLAAPASAGPIVPCVPLASYTPDPGVAYEPDVDVGGRTLVPVEERRSRSLAIYPQSVHVIIEVPLREADAAVDDDGRVNDIDATAKVGTVTLDDGVVHFNGRPLQPRDGCLVVEGE
ncbi:MAG: hypothetical protein EXQ94_01255 [Alphaproteobacteria bacterium]|nr:hypothetical protein [Alphaproteobacteria bacterium]